ncbi:bS18 family ribosomal protein [Candidatus Vidania fulgoroideorum]
MIDFKNIKLLVNYIDEFNNIKKRNKKTTLKEQRKIAKSIKIARFLGFLRNN